jgi:hypothetical protein
VGFEPTIPASERAKTGYSLDRVATVTGVDFTYLTIILSDTFQSVGNMNAKVPVCNIENGKYFSV